MWHCTFCYGTCLDRWKERWQFLLLSRPRTKTTAWNKSTQQYVSYIRWNSWNSTCRSISQKKLQWDCRLLLLLSWHEDFVQFTYLKSSGQKGPPGRPGWGRSPPPHLALPQGLVRVLSGKRLWQPLSVTSDQVQPPALPGTMQPGTEFSSGRCSFSTVADKAHGRRAATFRSCYFT